MPPRTNDFQRLIAFLEQQLAANGAVVTQSAMLQPTDGSPQREVDILIEGRAGQHPFRIAIECRAHTRKQGVEWIESIVGKYEHLPVDKVVAVSKSGFTASAAAAAVHRHIDTLTLREVLRADWAGIFDRFRIGLVVWKHRVKTVEVNYVDGPKLDITGPELLSATISDGDGRTQGTFTQDVEQLSRDFVRQDVVRWARDNARDILGKPPGHLWELRMPFTATNRYLTTDKGVRRQIAEVILWVACAYEFQPAPLTYYRYHDTVVGTGAVQHPISPSSYSFSVVFDDAGKPTAVNVSGSSARLLQKDTE